MNFNNISIRPCKYKVNTLTLKIDGRSDYEVDPRAISEIVMEKDFDNYAFPYFEFTISIPPSVYRSMKMQGVEVRAYLDLAMAFGTDDIANTENDDTLSFQSKIQQNFYVFKDDATPDITAGYTEAYEAAETDTDSYGIGDMATLRIALYNEEYLFRARKQINAVLKDCDILTGVTYILNKARLTKILCSPPANKKKYEQLIIPPLAATEDLDYLANTYAMHKCGTVIFFDFDRGYIIDKDSKCTAWESNEVKTTYFISLTTADSSTSFRQGCCYDASSRSNVINIEASSLVVRNQSLINDQVIGSDLLMVDSKSGDISRTKSNAYTSSSGGTTKVLVSNSGENTSSATAATLKEASKIISVTMAGVDIEMLTPNKEFIFTFDNSSLSEYAGSYRLSSLKIAFQKNGELFIPYANAEFKGYN